MMKRILICDDHPLFADSIAKSLNELKYEVRLVNNKNSYIKILKSEKFHEFIFDLNLKSDVGFELLNETKKT